MTTEQIYTLVNEVNKQAFGENALQVVDTSTLISLGNTVLSSSTNTEAFMNTLAQRIGKTILRFREYRNKLGDMVLSDFEFGAILQKIKVNMPEAEADESYDLIDGNTVDHYKVAKPDVDQKLFVTRTPYQYHITTSRATLKEAFLSDSAMGSFIGIVFGEVRNAIECGLENLARITLATAIAEYSTVREIKLVTNYNAEFNPPTPLTAATALTSDEFIRYAMGEINLTIDNIQDMSELYNDGSLKTFTPAEDVRIKLLSKFVRRAQTVTQYAAFNERFVDVDSQYSKINFWQSEQTPANVIIKRPSDGIQTTVENIIGVLHDRDAMGVYQIEEDVLTTPVNAAGRYYNTYYHEKQLRALDLSENGLIFTLN